MTDIKQKNLKLTQNSVELLRFLAYLEDSTESEVVEQALVKSIALTIAEKLQTANLAPVDGDDGDWVVEARFMTTRLQSYDPKCHWRVSRNQEGYWHLQFALVSECDSDDDWKAWPWDHATNPPVTNSLFIDED